LPSTPQDIVLLEGNGEFTVADKRFDVRAGDIVVLKSLVTPGACRTDSTMLFLLLEFTEDYIARRAAANSVPVPKTFPAKLGR
jgi:quercetin dioxygenase-like cupin family protein